MKSFKYLILFTESEMPLPEKFHDVQYVIDEKVWYVLTKNI